MESQQIIAYGAPLEARTDPTPSPVGSEVLVRITYCGVCHSDVHLHDGAFHLGKGQDLDVRAGRKLPFTLGHEIVGIVEALGPDAKGVTVGDHRVVYPWIGCGVCPACQRGDEPFCVKPRQLGIQVNGGFSDHVMVPDARYLIAFDGIEEARAAPFACSGLTAYSALRKLGPITANDPVLIVGAGGVGMMGISFAKALFGTAPILVADIDPGKREAALAAGATAVYDPKDPSAVKDLLKTYGGAAGAVDFVGAEASLGFAIGALRRGGSAVIVGLFGGHFEMPIVMFPMRGISIGGSYVGTLAEMQETMELARAGKIAPIPMDVRPMSAASQSLDDLRKGTVLGRVVLKA
jgi:D-arabinose 1-dehydrogenase-like Zn-dependent alcohol dehydrogenase